MEYCWFEASIGNIIPYCVRAQYFAFFCSVLFELVVMSLNYSLSDCASSTVTLSVAQCILNRTAIKKFNTGSTHRFFFSFSIEWFEQKTTIMVPTTFSGNFKFFSFSFFFDLVTSRSNFQCNHQSNPFYMWLTFVGGLPKKRKSRAVIFRWFLDPVDFYWYKSA